MLRSFKISRPAIRYEDQRRQPGRCHIGENLKKETPMDIGCPPASPQLLVKLNRQYPSAVFSRVRTTVPFGVTSQISLHVLGTSSGVQFLYPVPEVVPSSWSKTSNATLGHIRPDSTRDAI